MNNLDIEQLSVSEALVGICLKTQMFCHFYLKLGLILQSGSVNGQIEFLPLQECPITLDKAVVLIFFKNLLIMFIFETSLTV